MVAYFRRLSDKAIAAHESPTPHPPMPRRERQLQSEEAVLELYQAGPFTYRVYSAANGEVLLEGTCETPRIRDELIVKVREGTRVFARPATTARP